MSIKNIKIDVILPVFNESEVLEKQLRILKDYLNHNNYHSYIIYLTVVDNGSTDQTQEVAKKLLKNKLLDNYIRIPEKGRGRALKIAMKKSRADVFCYMDIDLSTDLQHFFPLINGIIIDNYDISIGSRLSNGSEVIGRKKIREITSRSYNIIVKILFPKSRIDDMQCGFKAISREKAQILLPLVKNNFWFFDTELLLLSRKLNLQIKQLPVKWIDDPSSSVNILKTAIEDLIGLIRIRINIK